MKGKSNKALGKGINAIFGSNVEQVLDEIQANAEVEPGRRSVMIPLNEIRPNPYQPRKEFDQKALKELAESIRVHGVFTPILVRKSVKGYELLAGERRLRAAKLAKLEKIPAIEMEFTEEEMMELSLLENIQRENLNPIEEALAYESLLKRLNYTQEKLAERVGKSRVYCANMMRLLNLPEEVQEMVSSKELSMGHARALLSLEKEETIIEVAKYIVKHQLSVRDVEQYVRELKGVVKQEKKKEVQVDPHLADLQTNLSKKLDTNVTLTDKKMVIKFKNTDEMNRILEILGCLEESL